MSKNPSKSVEIMARVRVARAEANHLRAPATALQELESAASRRRAERALTLQLARLGAIFYDAVGDGREAVRGLLAELMAGMETEQSAHGDLTAGLPTETIAAPCLSPAAAEAPLVSDPSSESYAVQAGTEREDTEETPREAVLVVTPDLCARLNAVLKGGATPDADDHAVKLVLATTTDDERPELSAENREELVRVASYVVAEAKNLRGPKPVEAELLRLETLWSETAYTWFIFGRAINHALMTYCVAAGRRVQALVKKEVKGQAKSGLGDRITRLFFKMNQHSKATHPGTVHGLALHHNPQCGDWDRDVQVARKRLESLRPDMSWVEFNLPATSVASAPVPKGSPDEAIRQLRDKVAHGLSADDFIGEFYTIQLGYALSERDPRLLGLAKSQLAETPELDLAAAGLTALARQIAADYDAEDSADPDPGDTPWALCAHTAGLRAVIVGGDRRPEREAAIKADLGLAELDWITTDQGMRHVQSLENRIQRGSVDLVLVVQRFISHKATDKLFAIKSESCRVVLTSSYGLLSVRQGLLRYLPALRAYRTPSH